MVRKRITKNGSKGKGKKPRALNRSDAKMKRWNTISDIPLDDEEQFHADRDRLLLDGEDIDEDLDQVDEVFGLKGLSDESEAEEEEDLDEEDLEEDEEPLPEVTKSKSKKKKAKSPPKSSEEDEESGVEESWGKGKGAYYSSNAAQIDSDDEEANELEEQEARKIQAKARDALNDDDFGYGGTMDDAEPNVDAMDALDEESALPQVPKDVLRHLQKTSPETIALTRDWEETAQNLVRAKNIIDELSADEEDSQRVGEMHFHYQTLLTYATNLAFYFYLRSNPKYSRKPELLKTHPIMAQLLTLKSALAQLESAGFAAWEEPEDDEETKAMFDAVQLWRLAQAKGLEKDELEELLRDANMVDEPEPSPPAEKKKKKKEVASTPVQAIIPPSAPPKKKRKMEKESGPSLPVFDLVEPEFVPSTKAKATPEVEDDAYGEVSSLQFADAADKKSRRKTLRFHTSRIESTSAKRQGARTTLGGDDDIPYRERKKDREARLAREAAAKGLGQGGEDLDDVEPEMPKSKKRQRDDDDEEEDEEDYYDLVKKANTEKKMRKKADYEAERAAARLDFEDDAASGPRSLTRAILKNKGLTPHRPKSVRNPRVKKREKFEKAKKKVGSQKAVYRGGIGPSGKYEGERTGITKVAKGIKLS